MDTTATITETVSPLHAEDERLLAIFKALSNPVRFRIVRYLVENPDCITGELVAFADLAQSTVSQHLKVLRTSGLVCGEVEGPAVSYCLNYETVAWFRNRVDAVADELEGHGRVGTPA